MKEIKLSPEDAKAFYLAYRDSMWAEDLAQMARHRSEAQRVAGQSGLPAGQLDAGSKTLSRDHRPNVAG